ncbi:MAG: DegT/DnrJ/EryC1/StrS family aminotransferase [Nitrospirae bacterium]|nr:DegT/DnrJ/EryC1/StrS family aminotransferase [Nitrospirota bacterium]MBF0540419.1 DegT/DnrJ/EryC1/StrS family aminotransferase [Nitrospirota bacterium]
MPGFEVFGEEERKAINEIFEINGGIIFAHSFDAMRKGVYRVREFEAAFAKRMDIKYAQAVSSGSTALKTALKALGIKRGDEVITTAFTFVATVEAILECGARPVIVDINETLNISPECFEDAISSKTRAVIPVHMMGVSAQMDEIMYIAKRNNLKVLEDTAQGLGGTYKGRTLGTIGDMGAFSLDAGKTIITGEGGMVITSDQDLYIRARSYHDHGHEYSSTVGRGAEAALITGFNYRMTELQGAIGIVQLGKLDMILARQRENKKKLKGAISDLPIKFRTITDESGDLGDTIVFFLDTREQAAKFVTKMAELGLGTKNLPDAIRWHFAKHWKHMFEEYNFYSDSYQIEWSKSADLLERAIALPVMVKMEDSRIFEIADKIRKIHKEL